MNIEKNIEDLTLNILELIKKCDESNERGIFGIWDIKKEIDYRTEKLHAVTEAIKSTKQETQASEELLNTLKSIDGTLKRIEQYIRHPYKNKDYECPF